MIQRSGSAFSACDGVVCARWGGDEFIILVAEAETADPARVAINGA